MSYSSGTTGYLYLNTSPTAEAADWVKGAAIRDWSLSSTQGALDTTTLGSTDRTVTPGVRSMNGSCTVLYYQPTAGSNTGNTCSNMVDLLVKERTSSAVPGVAAPPQTVFLRLGNTDGLISGAADEPDGHWIEVEALITSASMRSAIGEVYQAAISFDVQGAPIQMRY